MMRKSIGIGSEVSQVIGLYYLSSVDNYIKIVRGFKYYARYMDDSYVIYHEKEVLEELLKTLKNKYNELGLTINDKKTHIIKLSKPMVYLKTTYILTDTGKVIMCKSKDTFKRERKKLKKFAESKISYDIVDAQYRSWRGTITQKRSTNTCIYHNYKQLHRMDGLYNRLFIKPFAEGCC